MRRLAWVGITLLVAVGLVAALPGLRAPRRTGPPNVILICVDGGRADHLGAYGYERDTSPWIAGKAREGVVFEHNYAQANESLYSHASLFASRYPAEMGLLSYVNFRLPSDIATLPRVLKAHGYRTGGFTGGGHIYHAFGFDGGFDVYTDSIGFESFFTSVPKALDWMQKQAGAPMFVFLHGYDCHRPYRKPGVFEHRFDPDYKGNVDTVMQNTYTLDRVYERAYYPTFEVQSTWTAGGQLHIDPRIYLQLAEGSRQGRYVGNPLSDRDVSHIVSHYDSSVAYADLQLGIFFARIAEMGLDASNTLVVMVADHGEDLMDHGVFNHRAGVHTDTLHVPLVFWGAGVDRRARGRHYDVVTENTDVLPTILSMLGLAAPNGLRGRDLSGLLRTPDAPVPEALSGRAAFAQGILSMSALVTRDHELIAAGAPCGTPAMRWLIEQAPSTSKYFELYDLSRDPVEKTNLVDRPESRDLLGRMRAELLARERVASPRDGGRTTPIDPKVLRSFRQHGYW